MTKLINKNMKQIKLLSSTITETTDTGVTFKEIKNPKITHICKENQSSEGFGEVSHQKLQDAEG